MQDQVKGQKRLPWLEMGSFMEMASVYAAYVMMQVLGTPTREEIHAMNPNYTEFKFPQIKAHPWSKVFSKRMPQDAVDLVRHTNGIQLEQKHT